ncbi:SDR family NAD(P)-dependent oxidoreductase [Granulosicoccus sp.]|nr:type I polyketide synthase [Granulosicoccus sp.]MDB4222561.1 SDR family NAD(P)-dependent oxidoreductase [Granulosicoccus sp.]
MSNASDEEAGALTLEQANAEIERLREQLAAMDDTPAAREPIAVVGMGCRYPGDVRTPEEFWELLQSGRDVLRKIPKERWDVDAYYDPEAPVPGKMYVKHGHFLDNIDQFDPQFFGLSPREADSLDPQQRLVMEISWETLEHAGIAPSSLKGGKTGVFVGQYWDDYSMQRIYGNDIREIDRYAQLSGLRGLTAGRICHILDSHGPAIQLDTACSSSSLAVHLACQSLRLGESDLALAGGVSLVLAPEHLIGICQMQALSPDGRCKTFDATADGFGQGEGCGMVALKRLSDAKADGDNILAVIQGSAVNHDGQARTVTTPSGPAQRMMLQEALDDAGLKANQIDYVETHGTGTPLGDPIEVMAIARVLCEGRTKPLYLGSVKTNVGHLDSAAGIVGLMKVVLSLQNDTIPSHLNCENPNRHIPWKDWPLVIPTENTPWQGEERFAGISAFGMSGTNVHLIVGQAPGSQTALDVAKNSAVQATTHSPANTLPSEHLLTLSAQSPAALPDLAERYAALLRDDLPEGDLQGLCFSAATGRSHFAHRATFAACDAGTLTQSLTEFANGQKPVGTCIGSIGRRAPKLAFLFTGQGAQHVGMGKELYETSATFRLWIDRCAELLEQHIDRPLPEFLWTGETLHQTEFTQPALFAIEYSLAKVFEEWGVMPDLLLGHSIGEYAAACIAGVFSLEEGIRLVAARGRLMQSLPSGGQMVSVATDEATVREAIGASADISVAAVNGPRSIVVSGDGDAVSKVVEQLHLQDIKTTALKVSHAFHSPLMDPILEEFRAVAATVNFSAPNKTLISNVTGEPWGDEQLSPDYWVEHLRGAVRFADGIAYAQSKKFQTFIEIGPRPTLLGLGRASVEADYGTWLPGLKAKGEWNTLLNTVAELYVRGVEIDWQEFYPKGLSKIQLPNYPWRYRRCWTDVVTTGVNGQRLHPLVHRRIENASSSYIFESTLSNSSPAYLDDHRVFGNVVFPASAFFEMAMVVARTVLEQDEVALTNVSIGRALMLSEVPATVQMVATPNADRFDFEISSRSTDASNAEWVSHTKGTLERRLPSPAASIDIQATLSGFGEAVDISELTARFEARGLEYFPRFRAIAEIYLATAESDSEFGSAFARIELPAEAILPGDSYRIHPVITDASFRIAEAMFPDEDVEQIHLPFGISGFSCESAASGTVWVKASGRQQNQTRVVNLELFNENGERIATVENLTLRSVPVFSLQRAMTRPRASKDVLNEWLYEFVWEESEDGPVVDKTVAAGDWLLLSDKGGTGAELVRLMQGQGHCVRVATDAAAVHTLIESNEAQSLTGIVHLWGMDACEAEPDAALLASLDVVQLLSRASITAKHWLVTQGAQAVAADDVVSPWQTCFWGFGRTLQVEHPGQLGACIDLSMGVDSSDADANSGRGSLDLELLAFELCHSSIDTEIAFRNGSRRVARLARPAPMDEPAAALELDATASYLVTGGVGALGLQIAQFLASSGAKHLLLTGRSGVSTDDQRTVLHALEDAGVTVDVVAADIGNADDVARVLSMAPRLRGIVHAAGVLDDGMLMQQTAERFQKVASPKVNGAWQLHSQTLELSLDFFVMFSSVASVIGSPGQSNYASANAFMDGLAHYRKSRGLPATAINWGPWADVGMASSEVVLRRLMHDGWQPMTTSQGCDFITHLLSARELPQAAVIPVEWGTFVQRIQGASDWSTLKHLIPADGSSPLNASAAESAAQLVKDASADGPVPNGRVDLVCSYLLERIAQTLRVPAADLDEFANLSALGIDSLTAVELRSWVQGDLKAELAVEQMFTTPSIRELAIAIDQLLGGTASNNEDAVQNINDVVPAQWVVCPQPRPNAKLRLICFPYAGGGASAFNDWADLVPDNIELCTVQLPGREERLREPLLNDMSELVEALTQQILSYTDRPFAFLGHSMGAIIAYEVACRLCAMNAAIPKHLFLSARAAPQLETNSEPMRFLENDQFIERLHSLYGAVPTVIRQSSELQAIFLPILRADVTLLETHIDVSAPPLECSITVFGGAGDPAISAAMLAGWQERTSAKFDQHELPGDHFFIHAQRDAVLSVIMEQLVLENPSWRH